VCASLSKFLDTEWAVIVYHALLAALQIFLELRESAHCARLAILGMSSIWCLSAQHCSKLVTDTMGCLGIMPLQCFNSFGNMTVVQSRNTSEDVWTHTVILTLRARHQISLRWPEMI